MTETAIIPDGSRVQVHANLSARCFEILVEGPAVAVKSKPIGGRLAYWVRMDDNGDEFWASADEVSIPSEVPA